MRRPRIGPHNLTGTEVVVVNEQDHVRGWNTDPATNELVGTVDGRIEAVLRPPPILLSVSTSIHFTPACGCDTLSAPAARP